MADYKQLYFYLFGAVADAVEALEQNKPICAKHLLITAMQTAEEQYLQAGDLPAESKNPHPSRMRIFC